MTEDLTTKEPPESVIGKLDELAKKYNKSNQEIEEAWKKEICAHNVGKRDTRYRLALRMLQVKLEIRSTQIEEDWKPNLLKETVLGVIVTESESNNPEITRFIRYMPIKFYWRELTVCDECDDGGKIKGIINMPYPTYEISYDDPYGESHILGYELPNGGGHQDWYEMMSSCINLRICEEEDEQRIALLTKYSNMCQEESKRHSSPCTQKCEYHDECTESN